jgi:hypothetical protein
VPRSGRAARRPQQHLVDIQGRCAAVLFLLDPDPAVRRAVAGALAGVASTSSPTEVRRLIAVRTGGPMDERFNHGLALASRRWKTPDRVIIYRQTRRVMHTRRPKSEMLSIPGSTGSAYVNWPHQGRSARTDCSSSHARANGRQDRGGPLPCACRPEGSRRCVARAHRRRDRGGAMGRCPWACTCRPPWPGRVRRLERHRGRLGARRG